LILPNYAFDVRDPNRRIHIPRALNPSSAAQRGNERFAASAIFLTAADRVETLGPATFEGEFEP